MWGISCVLEDRPRRNTVRDTRRARPPAPAACRLFGRTEEEIRAIGPAGLADQVNKRGVTLLKSSNDIDPDSASSGTRAAPLQVDARAERGGMEAAVAVIEDELGAGSKVHFVSAGNSLRVIRNDGATADVQGHP